MHCSGRAKRHRAPLSSVVRGKAYVRTHALFVALVVLLAACSSRAPFHTEATIGRITEVTERDGGPSGPVTRTLVLPVGGVFVPLTVSAAKASSPFYTYKLRDESGRIIQTQTTKEFQLNQCVCLWHAPQVSNSSPEYNFVLGTLEEGTGCL